MFYYFSSLILGLSPFLLSLLLSCLRSLAHTCRLGAFKLRSSPLAILCLLPLALSFGPVVQVYSAQVSLQWDANTDPIVAGYKVYYGTTSHNYSSHIDVGKTTTYTVSNLPDGVTHYFATTDYSNSGMESGFSNEVVLNAAPNCTYSLSPAAQSFGASPASGSVNVNAGVGCPWIAVSNATWITITSNSSVTGGGTINYSVASNSSSASRSGTMTIAQQTFTVTQSGAPQYTLSTAKSGTGTGTVTNNPVGTTFNAGTAVTLTATPDASSTFAGWSGACTGASPTCLVTMNGNTSVNATFNLKTFTINASAGANGSISPQGALTLKYGSIQGFTVTPNSSYQVADVKVDGSSVGAVTSYSFTNVTTNHTIQASFGLPTTYTLSANKSGTGSGTVTNNPVGTTFNAGTAVTLTATPDASSTFAGWSGACTGTSPTCSVTMDGNTEVTATFNLKTFTINASAGTNGSISPQGTAMVNYGASQNFTITPATGYGVSDIQVDGVSVGTVNSYLFGNVMTNHTISASFNALPPPSDSPKRHNRYKKYFPTYRRTY